MEPEKWNSINDKHGDFEMFRNGKQRLPIAESIPTTLPKTLAVLKPFGAIKHLLATLIFMTKCFSCFSKISEQLLGVQKRKKLCHFGAWLQCAGLEVSRGSAGMRARESGGPTA